MDNEFVQIVVKWLKADDKIKELSKQVKELKEEKKQYEEYILGEMKSSNQEILNMSSGGSIRRSISKTKGSLKQEYIKQILTEYTKDNNEANLITESLMNNRPITERTYLKRTVPRKPKGG